MIKTKRVFKLKRSKESTNFEVLLLNENNIELFSFSQIRGWLWKRRKYQVMLVSVVVVKHPTPSEEQSRAYEIHALVKAEMERRGTIIDEFHVSFVPFRFGGEDNIYVFSEGQLQYVR